MPGVARRIVFVGDSFTHGTGDPDAIGWVGRVYALARGRGHDVTAYNLGIRRDTSADIAARWEREVAARLPKEQAAGLVFCFGSNDCNDGDDGTQRVAPETTLGNARRLLIRAKAMAPCLMLGPPPLGRTQPIRDRVAVLTGRLAAECRNLDVPFLDTFTPLTASGTWTAEAAKGDGAHPGAAGYAELAMLVDGWRPWRDWLP